jgi:hypothetical protein
MANKKQPKSFFIDSFHDLWGGFYILHPSEILGPKDKFIVNFGLGSLGLRAYKNATDDFVYPFIIDSNFHTNSMEVQVTLQTFGAFKDPSSNDTFNLSNSNHQKQFELVPFQVLRIIVENTSESLSIIKSTIRPVFIYTAG